MSSYSSMSFCYAKFEELYRNIIMITGRHLRNMVLGLVLGTLVTIVFFTAPNTIILSTFSTLRYDLVQPNEVRLWGEYEDSSDPQKRRSDRINKYAKSRICRPQHHIMFLKTHKCGSSAVQNILLRYGYKHNLTFALPTDGNYFGHPELFEHDMIPEHLMPPSGKVDIFAVHCRLNMEEHSRILSSDATWITILREPAALQESLFTYYRLENFYSMNISEYISLDSQTFESLPRFHDKLGRNQMLFDLGYNVNSTVEEVSRAIEEIENRFDLVMIAEFMDESLILLRHLLCWTLNDVVVFMKNARTKDNKHTLDFQSQLKFRDFNNVDVLLYNHFLAQHQQAISEFGVKRMAFEVAALRKLRDEYYRTCVAQKVTGKDDSLQFKEYSALVGAYVISNNSSADCFMLSLPEVHFLDAVRMRQAMYLNSTNITEKVLPEKDYYISTKVS